MDLHYALLTYLICCILEDRHIPDLIVDDVDDANLEFAVVQGYQ